MAPLRGAHAAQAGDHEVAELFLRFWRQHDMHSSAHQCKHNSQAQPFASSMVSARSEVLLGPFSRVRSLRISLASMLMAATSLTMHPILSLVFSSRLRRRVVLPASTALSCHQVLVANSKNESLYVLH